MIKIGRPSIYTPELAKTICDRMAEGESLRSICKDEDMPNRSTIFLWQLAKPEFSDQYAEARQQCLEHWTHEIIDISDGVDLTDGLDSNSQVMRDRLRVDSRKWIMSKLAPKKFGDSKQVNVAVGGEISHIHKTDAQILEELESSRERRRKRVELRKLKLRDSTPPR